MTPFKGRNRVTSLYGYRTLNGVKEFHNGQDIVGDDDRNVRAIWNCVKTEAVPGYNGGRGNLVRLYYSNTLRVICQHLDSIAIKTGQVVMQGDKVGVMGNTGYSFGAHLHIEVQVYRGGKWTAINPAQYTEVPNKIGTHPGNNNKDDTSEPGTLPEPAPDPKLYMLSIGPASIGDKNTLEAIAESLSIPCKITEA